jgi:CRP-like cAMP-binding protein
LNLLSTNLNKISPLSHESESEFLSVWKYWSVPKDHLLVRQNTVSDYIYFIERGVARIFYYKNEKEITEWIAMDEQFFLSISSFYQRIPGRLVIQTLEPSEVYGIYHDDLMSLANKYHDVERLLRNMMTGGFIMSQQRMFSIQFESAKQRYENLLKNTPDIIRRVPLSYIASFLGVTLETLSRIRSAR